MADWANWWHSLTPLNQCFYSGAAFFSILFLWQVIGGFIGMLDSDAGGVDHGGFGHVGHGDSSHGGVHTGTGSHGTVSDHGTIADFKLITVRSMLAFFTLFFWAGALYLSSRVEPFWGMTYSVLWGLAAMFAVAGAFYVLQRLVENGTPNIATCVGTRGVVYLDIPEGGNGEARVMISGAVSHIRAQAVGGRPIKAGTPVRVLRAVSATTVEVEPFHGTANQQGVA